MSVTLASSFNGIAEQYDRARPGYPAKLIDRIFAFGALDETAHALELGVGSGKATLPFAERGVRILGLEPGPALAEVARARLARFPNVSISTTSFEDWPISPAAFDLVFAAQSFHWLDPVQRLPTIAQALRRPGTLAIFGHSSTTAEDPSHARIQSAYRRVAPSLAERDAAREWYGSAGGPVAEELSQSALFTDVSIESFAWRRSLSSSQYCEVLGTYSDHSTLPTSQREALLAAIAEAVRESGDQVVLDYRTTLFLARAV